MERRVLVIKGSLDNGDKVVKILEMLGGVNSANHLGNSDKYYIGDDREVIKFNYNDPEFIEFTLDEFTKNYPYSIGDWVSLADETCIISDMYWTGYEILYGVSYLDGDKEFDIKCSELNKKDILPIELAEQVYEAEGYSTGDYCHKQSFLWGFQEGYETLKKLLLS